MTGKHIRVVLLVLLAVIYLIWKFFPEKFLQGQWNILEIATLVISVLFIGAILFRPIRKVKK